MDILIKNAVIVTCADRVYSSGCIVIRKDTIERICEASPPDSVKYDRIIDARGMIAMPGLVNAHTHSSMTILRNYGGGLGLEDWLNKKIFPAEEKLAPEDMYHGTMLAGIEMIKSGTTAFADMYLAPDENARAVIDLGMRANICVLPIDPAGKGVSPLKGFYNKWNARPDKRIRPYVLVHSAYLYGEREMIIAASLAAETGTGIHTHLLETETEYREGIERYGTDNAKEMLKCGIFDVPAIAAHCVYVTDEDIAILKSKNVNVAYNPTSNLKLGSGIAPARKMLDAGINVCLGTDGPASNNALDMFAEMKLASILQKGAERDPLSVDARQALKLATCNGAKALGFEYEFGVIKAGARADIILIDTDKPHLTPLNDPEEAIVYCCRGSDVDTVIADGRILMEGRELVNIDEEKIKYEVNRIAKRILVSL